MGLSLVSWCYYTHPEDGDVEKLNGNPTNGPRPVPKVDRNDIINSVQKRLGYRPV